MGMIEELIGDQLPSDDDVLAGLQKAMGEGKKPCDLLKRGYDENSYLRAIIRKYPKTLAFLAAHPDWLQSDINRLLPYLVTLANFRG